MAIDDKQLIALLTNFKDEIVQSVDHRLGGVQEDFQHKLDLVVEGQQLLAETLGEIRSELKAEIVKVDQRVTMMAADLAAHRRDTEAHRKGWHMNDPVVELRKASRITGKSLVFRDACVDDAEFILSLRTDERKSRHLSSTSPELVRQVEWLINYAGQGGQAYFIIENLEGERLGTVRLYDAQGNSFCWGSWIIKDGAPSGAAIESALMVYAYAIEHLGFEQAHFDVRKGNESVWRFHERFGAVRAGETDMDYLYKLNKDRILSSREKYHKYLSDVVVEY